LTATGPLATMRTVCEGRRVVADQPVEDTDQPADSTGASSSAASGRATGRGVRAWAGRYRTSLWLFAVAIVLGVAAYVLYPTDAPVAPVLALQGVAVVADFTPTSIDVLQSPDQAVHGIHIEIDVRTQEKRVHDHGWVAVGLPLKAWGSVQACPDSTAGCRTSASADQKLVYLHLPHHWTSLGSSGGIDPWDLRLRLDVAEIGTNLVQNHEYAATLVPPISFQLATKGASSTDTFHLPYVQVPTNYGEVVRGASAYTWNLGGAVPDYAAGYDRWTGASAAGLASAAEPTYDSAVNLDVQAHDSDLQFIVGVLVGIAGGALIGGVQTAIDTRRKRPRLAGGET
jgi:hypothetical protein